MNPFWLIRLARWARHPPGGRQALFLIAVVLISLGIVALSRAGLWPDWARLHGGWSGGWHRL